VIIDSFMFNNEFDMLECRLTEIGDAVDRVIVVEADVDHQDHPKPYHLSELGNGRFDKWCDKMFIVRAHHLPTLEQDPDPWAREYGQREWVFKGLEQIDAGPDDIVLHGDLDEIPTAVAARNVKPRGFVTFQQRGHFWAVDWQYPKPWHGTVAARVRDIKGFGALRSTRNTNPLRLPNAGWHLSWLPVGGLEPAESAMQKVGSFCHPEVRDSITLGLKENSFLVDGYHVDGEKMLPVDVDSTWPKWIVEGNAPATWFRSRA
jgi:hypothetical protein